MSQNEKLILKASVKDLFDPLLKDVSVENKFRVSEESSFYLLSILESYAFSAKPFSENTNEMMSERLFRALQEEGAQKREQSLKRLGDSILFQIGFFGDFLKRKIIGINFYSQIGVSAYSTLSQETDNLTYRDISRRFSGYVDLFSSLRNKVSFKKRDDLIYLFDRYFEGNSKMAEKELFDQGIFPQKGRKVSN